MSTNRPTASTDDGRRLYEQRKTGGPSWVDSGEPEPTEITFGGGGGDSTSSGSTVQSGEQLYRRRHGQAS